MLSDAAFASVLTGSYRAKLLLPQLKPPVNNVAQVNRDAAARADARQSDVNAARRAESQRLMAVSLERAAALQAVVRPVATPPATEFSADRVTISRVSEIARETLANTPLSSGKDIPAPTPEVRKTVTASTNAYSLRDITKIKAAVVAPPLPLVLAPPVSAVSSPIVTPSSSAATQQYQRNETSSSAVSQSGGAATSSSGVNVRA